MIPQNITAMTIRQAATSGHRLNVSMTKSFALHAIRNLTGKPPKEKGGSTLSYRKDGTALPKINQPIKTIRLL
jgi:hypothetical protein